MAATSPTTSSPTPPLLPQSGRQVRALIGAGRQGPAWSVAVGAGAVAAAFGAKLFLDSLAGENVAYIPLFVAVATASLAAGFASGLLAAGLGAVLDVAVFQVSRGTPFLDNPGGPVRFVLFLLASGLIAWLVSATRIERERAREAADRFSRLLEDSPDFIVLIDPRTWRIDFANAACTGFGWEPERLLGKSAEAVIPGLRELEVAPRTTSPTGAVSLLAETGEARPVELLTRRIDLGRSGTRLFVSARDMTERVDSTARLLRLARIERARAAEFQAVIDSIDDGVAVFAPGGEVVLVNEGVARLAGRRVASESDLWTALGVALDVSAAATEPGGRSEIHLVDPDRWLEMRRFAVHTDDDDGPAEPSSLVVLRDTTAGRASREAREAFLGILSHELRTPVTTILGITHLLGRRSPRLSADQRHDLALDVAAEAERLRRLVEDLLVLSRSEGGRLEFEPEPMLIQHAIPAVIAAESRHTPHLRFVADIPPSLPPIAGDRTYVDQVLRNLIGNAAKYSLDRASEVRVEAAFVEQEIVVRVLDRGPGFDPRDATRLFDIFFRAEGTARARSGAGIGLFVTKSLIEIMNGRVWARLRHGGGSEFGFALPVLADDLDPEEQAAGNAEGESQPVPDEDVPPGREEPGTPGPEIEVPAS